MKIGLSIVDKTVLVQTLEEIRDETIAPQRLNATLIGLFALLALAIAMVGVGGVLAFSVSQRTNELGIRMSLGAEPGAILRMILGEGCDDGRDPVSSPLTGRRSRRRHRCCSASRSSPLGLQRAARWRSSR